MLEAEQNLKNYLDGLDKTPLLKRQEERQLLQDIEIIQEDIIQTCLKYEEFRTVLLKVLKKHLKVPVDKITRQITPNSTTADKRKVKIQFLSILEDLNADKDVTESLKAFALSGNVVHAVIEDLKNTMTEVREVENSLKKALLFFEVSTAGDASKIIKSIERDLEVTKYYCLKFRVTEGKLLNRCNDVKQLIKQSKKPENLKYKTPVLKELYSSLITKEYKMDQSRSKLIKGNLRLVVSRAKRFVNRGLELEDLIQEGNFGLIKAVNKHDASRGTKVATYATWWIDQSIRRALSNKAKQVRVPTHIENIQSKVSTIITDFQKLKGRQPTLEEIAKAAKLNKKDLEKIELAEMIQIETEDVETGVSLFEVIEDDKILNPEDQLALKELKYKVRECLSRLSPKHEKIIRMRFGIGESLTESTMEEVADHVGYTKMGVSKVVTRTLKLIKKEITNGRS